jgi:hypothetical protein
MFIDIHSLHGEILYMFTDIHDLPTKIHPVSKKILYMFWEIMYLPLKTHHKTAFVRPRSGNIVYVQT